MKTFVEFRSSKFPKYEGEEDEINPGLWGRRLAEYLVSKLAEHGLQPRDIIPEDWGWYIPIDIDGVTLAVCCGHQSGEDDEFLCFTDPQQPIVRRLFKTIDLTEQLTRLTAAIAKILQADRDVRHIVARTVTSRAFA